jgi:hypothetical protein
MTFAKTTVSCAAIAIVASAANAQRLYTDRTQWEIDVAATILTETFDGINVSSLQPSLGTVPLNIMTVTVTGVDSTTGSPAITGGTFQGALFPATGHTSYVFDLRESARAFGVDVFGANTGIGLGFEFGGFEFDLNDAGFSSTQDGFVGVILLPGQSDDQIVMLPGTNPGPVGEIFDADDLSYAGESVVCYPDCDGNTVLDVFDFLCFQDAFVAMAPYADCDGNSTFDVFDFLCFQDEFVMGCP